MLAEGCANVVDAKFVDCMPQLVSQTRVLDTLMNSLHVVSTRPAVRRHPGGTLEIVGLQNTAVHTFLQVAMGHTFTVGPAASCLELVPKPW